MNWEVGGRNGCKTEGPGGAQNFWDVPCLKTKCSLRRKYSECPCSDRCYPNVSGAILILAIFVYCLYVCPQCQLPRYEIKKWLDCFKCGMVEIEVSFSGYGSALLPVLLSSAAGSPTQPIHRDGCLRLHGLLEFSPFPPKSQHCYPLMFYSKYLYRHGGQGGRGWGSRSRVEELALALSQAGLVFTIGQWRSIGHDSITEHQILKVALRP